MVVDRKNITCEGCNEALLNKEEVREALFLCVGYWAEMVLDVDPEEIEVSLCLDTSNNHIMVHMTAPSGEKKVDDLTVTMHEIDCVY